MESFPKQTCNATLYGIVEIAKEDVCARARFPIRLNMSAAIIFCKRDIVMNCMPLIKSAKGYVNVSLITCVCLVSSCGYAFVVIDPGYAALRYY